MRNRVAHHGVHRIRALAVRTAAVLTLLPALLLAAAAIAAADPTAAVAEERLSVGLAGPVGIVAVILGAAGVLIGLLRRRRTLRSTAVPASRPTPAEATRTDTTVKDASWPTRYTSWRQR